MIIKLNKSLINNFHRTKLKDNLVVINIKLTDIHIKIAEQLLIKINDENDNIKITYGDLSKRMGGYPHWRNLNRYLGDLSSLCHDNDLPLISAIVVNAKTRVAGDGFLGLYHGYLKTEQEKDKKYIECLEEVRRYKHWDRLKNILSIE
jgi:hypothetical protein